MAVLLAIVGAGLISYLTLVWFLAGWLGLTGNPAIILRLVLSLIGIAGAAFIVWFQMRRKAAQSPAPATGAAGAQSAGLASDVQFVLREANARLRASTTVRKGGKNLSAMPLVMVVGEGGATKTTAVLHSGLDPELLSGQPGQDGAAVPTPAVNVWLAADTAFVEAGGPVANDAAAWSRLVDSLRAGGLANLLGRTAQSPRAVVLCVDASALANAQAGAAVTALARKYNAALGEVAQRWGNRLPVYVLFTKLDQVPYFTDYARNLTQDQVTAVFGSTLPLAGGDLGGGYNEQQARRLTEAFEVLFLSLAERRMEQLRREADPSKLPNIYEFPREFRKLRDNAVRFLLDVGRPSQLRTSAFLRGFYFIGVRPVVAEEQPAARPAAPPPDAGATRIFSGGAAAMAQAMAARTPTSRRVPQWVFIRRFFSDVLLQDRAARGTSGANTRASGIRRWLLTLGTLLCLIWIIGSTVSWSHNKTLIERAKTASQVLASGTGSPGQPLTVDQLKRLEEIRQVVEQVSGYERDGAPFSYRWGLYPGHSLYEDVRSLYCRDLGRTLLGPARSSMESTLAALHTMPGPNDDYERNFNTLKAYLMTTANPEKTEPPFLRDQLVTQYAGNRQLAADQAALVRDQFAYYAAERPSGMCPATEDKDAVERARTHLWNYPLVERTYRNIINEVSKKHPSVRYTDPSGTGSVVDPYEVAGAFTKEGWGSVKQALAKSSGGETWVLGAERGGSAQTSTDLQQDLKKRYVADYIAQWNNYLDKGYVAPYANFGDAAKKLDAMTTSKSSLLALVCLASVNTAVDSPEVTKEFAGLQQLVPPATCTEKPIDAPAQAYMQALNGIAVRVADIAKRPDASGESIDSTAAHMAARSTTQSLNLSTKVDKLLNDPILHADRLLELKAPEALNGKGADFCQQARSVLGKFPFNLNGREDARLDEVAALFAPQGGLLAKFYQESLQEVLVPSGSGYAPKTGARFKVTGSFLNFINRASWISRTLYANPSKPGFMYNVQPLTSPGIENFQLSINGKTLSATGGGGPTADFAWTGEADTLKLNAKAMTGSIQPVEERGPWAIFHFLSRSEDPASANGVYDFRLQSSFGRQTQASSTQAVLKLRASSGGNPLSLAVTCVGRIAQ